MAAKSNRELRDGRALDYCQGSDEPGRERLVVLDSDSRVTTDSPNRRLLNRR